MTCTSHPHPRNTVFLGLCLCTSGSPTPPRLRPLPRSRLPPYARSLATERMGLLRLLGRGRVCATRAPSRRLGSVASTPEWFRGASRLVVLVPSRATRPDAGLVLFLLVCTASPQLWKPWYWHLESYVTVHRVLQLFGHALWPTPCVHWKRSGVVPSANSPRKSKIRFSRDRAWWRRTVITMCKQRLLIVRIDGMRTIIIVRAHPNSVDMGWQCMQFHYISNSVTRSPLGGSPRLEGELVVVEPPQACHSCVMNHFN